MFEVRNNFKPSNVMFSVRYIVAETINMKYSFIEHQRLVSSSSAHVGNHTDDMWGQLLSCSPFHVASS